MPAFQEWETDPYVCLPSPDVGKVSTRDPSYDDIPRILRPDPLGPGPSPSLYMELWGEKKERL